MSCITNIADSIFIPEISHVEVRNIALTLRNSIPGWNEISAISINRILIVND